jgi:hypothetical protein
MEIEVANVKLGIIEGNFCAKEEDIINDFFID